MTHDGSFPGRPRGRGARPDNGGPDWPGYDATQLDQREFPGLDQRGLDQPGPGQREPGRPARGREPEEDIPDWAEPDSMEAFSSRWHRRGLDSRRERRSGRRKHRRVLIGAGGAAAVVIAVAVYFLIGGNSSSSPTFGSLVTTFLPGELPTVPNACDTVPAALLNEFLPGTLKQASPPLNTGANTECTWTLDNRPTYRVLQVELVAYAPSALYGNGSATVVAAQAYASSQDSLAKPGPRSDEPAATVTQLSGMPGGRDTSAFEATQVSRRSGAISDVANVLVRYRNVVVTVVVDGLMQSNGARKYGPVSMSDLSTAATTVARKVTATIVG